MFNMWQDCKAPRDPSNAFISTKYEWQIKFWSWFMTNANPVEWWENCSPWLNCWWISAGTLYVSSSSSLAPSSFFSFTHTFTLTQWVFDKPGNGAVEMFSRRTMQIRPYPQGDTVNGFNHRQNLHRGVCVCECVRLCKGIKHKHASG